MLSQFEKFELTFIPIMMIVAILIPIYIGNAFIGEQANSIIVIPLIVGILVGLILGGISEFFIYPLTTMRRFTYYFRAISIIMVIIFAITLIFNVFPQSYDLITIINAIFGILIAIFSLSCIFTYWNVYHPSDGQKKIKHSLFFLIEEKLQQKRNKRGD